MTLLQNQSSFFPASALMAPSQRPPDSGPSSLFEEAQAAADEAMSDVMMSGCEPGGSLAFQPRFMLCVLTYCYARQVYSSRDIEKFLSGDAVFVRACGGCWPDWSCISRFRRENNGPLQRCLTAALHFLARRHELAGDITHFKKPSLAEEARRRLIMAAFTDSMEAEVRDWRRQEGLQRMLEGAASAV